jgi:teichuronic acid biosynthesis glycosyltransferase TuaH
MGLRESVLRRAEARQLRKATDVLAVSPELRARWSRPGREPLLMTNGCDVETFARTDAATRPTDLQLEGPVAGVIGQITARIDLRLLEAVAESGCGVLLVGPIDPSFEPIAMRRLLRLPNVQAVGQRPFDQLPSYLGAIDVGLTPYVDSAFNRASFPLKTLEYLAAGRPVVSTDLPAARWLDTDLIRVASTPAAFTAATRAAAAEARTPTAVQARRAFARTHSWERRGDELARLVLEDVTS